MAMFWRHVLQFPVAIVMAAYYALTAVIEPIVTPIARMLARLRVLAKLRAAIERLGPYPSLILLAVPVIVIEPLKIGALAILASGRIVLGTVSLVISHGLSLILIERLFEVVKPKLLMLPWFAKVWGWFTDLRDQLLTWIRSTWAWSLVIRVRNEARAIVARVIRRSA